MNRRAAVSVDARATRGARAPVLGLLAAFALAVAGCGPRPEAHSPASSPPGTRAWLTTIDVAHPLVGRIWDARAGAFVTRESVFARTAAVRFVLLGEKHDNPDHHGLQALVLKRLVDAGRRPRVLFEMLDVTQQGVIDAYRRTPGASASGFGAKLDWGKSGWPPFAEYEPIFDVAFAAGLPIVAANLEQARARALVHQGLAALEPQRAASLGLEQPFPPGLERALEQELAEDHCGMLPESLLGPMALAQHARDAQMASALLGGNDARAAVLIAGGGHVRRDRGVPYYLEQRGVTSVVALDFIEVEAGLDDPKAYVPSAPGGAPAVDFVWFTPRVDDGDPCAAFERRAEPAKTH